MQLERVFTIFAFMALAGCVSNLQSTGKTSGTGIAVSLPSNIPVAANVVPSEVLNHDVRQETIYVTICVPGYTASVRPSTSFTNGIKTKLMREAGIPAEAASSLELDHTVSLGLGGHPRNLRNLALQPLDGGGGAKQKDRLERRLQAMVCSRQISLAEAQWEIYSDWKSAFIKYIRP